MVGFTKLPHPINVRVIADCIAIGDHHVEVKLKAMTRLTLTMRSYDGRMHALDPTKVEERSILIDESLTLCCVQQCPSRPYSVLRELNVPLDGKPDETVHIQIYDEVSLIETFGDFAVVSVRGTHAIVRITDIEALPESIVGQRLAV